MRAQGRGGGRRHLFGALHSREDDGWRTGDASVGATRADVEGDDDRERRDREHVREVWDTRPVGVVRCTRANPAPRCHAMAKPIPRGLVYLVHVARRFSRRAPQRAARPIEGTSADERRRRHQRSHRARVRARRRARRPPRDRLARGRVYSPLDRIFAQHSCASRRARAMPRGGRGEGHDELARRHPRWLRGQGRAGTCTRGGHTASPPPAYLPVSTQVKFQQPSR